MAERTKREGVGAMRNKIKKEAGRRQVAVPGGGGVIDGVGGHGLSGGHGWSRGGGLLTAPYIS